jgi:hypothetical protein
VSEKPEHESGAEHAIEHAEKVTLKFMAAAGLTMVVASGLIVEAGNLRTTYVKEFGTPPAIVQMQDEHHQSDPFSKDKGPQDPENKDTPLKAPQFREDGPPYTNPK